MPGFNQTGPVGLGPMTGRRMGRCTNFGAQSVKQVENEEVKPEENQHDFPFGRGFGRGRGRRGLGMGRQNRFRGGGF